ncbi:MAG TPA: class I SAM-dependent methyltransferase [Solirubrobacteraceae bacterium]|nr:class I SAM-dependent methyltransferase [Solirubrobacteraceae bacterium]
MDQSLAHNWKEPGFAAQWDTLADQVNPVRREQLDLLLALLRAHNPATVLDVGVGSGLVAEMVLDTLPEARVIGVDASPAMLALAGDRLSRFSGRARLVEADLEDVVLAECLDGPVEAAISVQTLHNLEPGAHRRALASIGDAVAPGALFVNADRYAVPLDLFGVFRVVWDRVGADEGATPEEHTEKLQAQGDRPVFLETELSWLRESGFEAVCLQCLGNRAVVLGRRRR